MKVKAKLKYLRIAPRKTRMVADLIRRKKVEQAQTILSYAVKRGANPVLKLLNSAVASAKNNFQLDPENLYISEITVDEGPKFKRWMPRSRGMAYEIQKKTSHVMIVLEEIMEGKKGKKSKKVRAVKEENVKKEEKPVASTATDKPAASEAKPKFEREAERQKPKVERSIKRFFRRKSV